MALPSNKSAAATTEAEWITGRTSAGSHRSCCCTTAAASASTLTEVHERRTSNASSCVVVVLSGRLDKIQGNAWQIVDVFADNHGSDDQNKEHDEHEKVQDSVANDTPLSEARLLDGVDRRSDLTAAEKVSR